MRIMDCECLVYDIKTASDRIVTVWRDVRVVEGARLESVYAGNRITGSNPVLSAIV
jgi:hypothetical protein